MTNFILVQKCNQCEKVAQEVWDTTNDVHRTVDLLLEEFTDVKGMLERANMREDRLEEEVKRLNKIIVKLTIESLLINEELNEKSPMQLMKFMDRNLRDFPFGTVYSMDSSQFDANGRKIQYNFINMSNIGDSPNWTFYFTPKDSEKDSHVL